MAFTTLTLAQLGNALAMRSEFESLWRVGILTNPMLLAAVILTVLLQLSVLYVPTLNVVFKTEPLLPTELGICFLPPVIVLCSLEGEKWLRRRRK